MGTSPDMDGYEVIGSDDGKLGRVVAVDGEFLIAEEGTLRKKRHAIPKAFAHPDDSEQVVRLTVSKELVEDSPTVKEGEELDRKAAAAHYGLAEGSGELTPDDPAWSAEQQEARSGIKAAGQKRVRIQEDESEPGPHGRPIIPSDSHDPVKRGALLDRFELAEPGLRHRSEDRVAVGLLVVPLQLHLTH